MQSYSKPEDLRELRGCWNQPEEAIFTKSIKFKNNAFIQQTRRPEGTTYQSVQTVKYCKLSLLLSNDA
jgi:hypothetical protein